MKCLAVMAVFAVTAGFAPYEVTRAEWQACYDSGGCSYLPPGPDSSSDFPVTGVNHFDVDEYIAWINAKTSKTHRLPTADEWAIASGGLSRRKSKKLFDDPRLAWAADYGAMPQVSPKLQPSGSFGAISGIYDLGGNVWEWTSTCAAADPENCPAYIVAGEHEATLSIFIRDPATGGCAAGVPPANVEFRLVLDEP